MRSPFKGLDRPSTLWKISRTDSDLADEGGAFEPLKDAPTAFPSVSCPFLAGERLVIPERRFSQSRRTRVISCLPAPCRFPLAFRSPVLAPVSSGNAASRERPEVGPLGDSCAAQVRASRPPRRITRGEAFASTCPHGEGFPARAGSDISRAGRTREPSLTRGHHLSISRHLHSGGVAKPDKSPPLHSNGAIAR